MVDSINYCLKFLLILWWSEPSQRLNLLINKRRMVFFIDKQRLLRYVSNFEIEIIQPRLDKFYRF